MMNYGFSNLQVAPAASIQHPQWQNFGLAIQQTVAEGFGKELVWCTWLLKAILFLLGFFF